MDMERVRQLEAKVAKLEQMLLAVMQGPFKAQKDAVAAMRPMFEEWEAGEGRFAVKPPSVKRKRRAINWVDYNAVMAEDDGSRSYREIAKSLGIPETTVRNYAKMAPDEVAALERAHIETEVGDE